MCIISLLPRRKKTNGRKKTAEEYATHKKWYGGENRTNTRNGLFVNGRKDYKTPLEADLS